MIPPRNEIEVPEDFPSRTPLAAVAGVQPKLAAALVDGKYVVPGQSLEDRIADYEMCEDLARQLMAYCHKKLPLFKSRKITLARVYAGLLAKNWCTPAQSAWTIRRTAVLLAWPVPLDAMVRAGKVELRFSAAATSTPGSEQP